MIVAATISSGSVDARYLASMIRLFAAPSWREADLEFVHVEGSYIGEQRDRAAREFLRMGGHWLLFSDADVTFTPQDVTALFDYADEKHRPIVAALALGTFRGTRGPVPSPVAWYDVGMTAQVEAEHGSPVRIGMCGFELVAIHRAVIESLIERHGVAFETGRLADGEFAGEDRIFYGRAQEAGFPVWLHRGVRVGHRKVVELRP